MLRFVTKSDIWSVQDEGAKACLTPAVKWHLKNIQDAIALERLGDVTGLVVGEIGGGRSRTLQALKEANARYNIDAFDGDRAAGLGPSAIPDIPGVTPIVGRVGDPPLDWPDASFDVLYSISVVEHVPSNKLRAFFDDCRRLLRDGGRLLHLIDVYLGDDDNEYAGRCLAAYAAPFLDWLRPLGRVSVEARFSCAYATNPDDAMAWWNEINPALAETRALKQSCTVLMEGFKA